MGSEATLLGSVSYTVQSIWKAGDRPPKPPARVLVETRGDDEIEVVVGAEREVRVEDGAVWVRAREGGMGLGVGRLNGRRRGAGGGWVAMRGTGGACGCWEVGEGKKSERATDWAGRWVIVLVPAG